MTPFFLLVLTTIWASCHLVAGFVSLEPSTTYNINHKKYSVLRASSNRNQPSVVDASGRTEANDSTPSQHFDTAICGGGPAGLLSAIMAAQRFPEQQIHVFEANPVPPPSIGDDAIWSDFDRFYTLGVFGRGKRALEEFGAWEAVESVSQELVGNQAWRTNDTSVEASISLFADAGREPIYALPRDKLVSALYGHIQEKYPSRIHFHFGKSVHPIDFDHGSDGEGQQSASVLFEIRTTEAKSATENSSSATAGFLIGADGAARTIANGIEATEKEEWMKGGIRHRIKHGPPFKVTRFPDTNPRVYKTIPVQLPSSWRQDIGYSASNGDRRYSIVSLPANRDGGLCAILLMKADDPLAKADTDPSEVRKMLDNNVPVFSNLVDDSVVARVAKKAPSTFPFFRYAGPRLHKGGQTVILGDSCHSVKPYNGLGVNSAFEDVRILSDILKKTPKLENAVQLFSKDRAKDCKAVVTLSRAGDRPGRIGFLSFLIPLLMDAFFNKILPSIFEPPIPGLIHNDQYRFHAVAMRKRKERTAQLAILSALTVLLLRSSHWLIRYIARSLAVSSGVVSSVLAGSFAIGWFAKKSLAKRQVRTSD